jgi:hypothetical protein
VVARGRADPPMTARPARPVQGALSALTSALGLAASWSRRGLRPLQVNALDSLI